MVNEGNQNAVGLKTPESQQAAFKNYCEHIREGYPKRAWYYRDKEGNHCAMETMEELIKKGVFDTELLREAKAYAYKYWFSLGKQMCVDKEGNAILKASNSIWQIIMKVKFGDMGWEEDKPVQSSTQVPFLIPSYEDLKRIMEDTKNKEVKDIPPS